MRSRGIKKQIWLSREEDYILKTKAETAGITASDLIRNLIVGYEPREKPPKEFYEAIKEVRADIVQNIEFGNEKDLVNFTQGIQLGSAIDSSALPMPWDMPGYDDKVIMASGSFTQGSSIELSCDGPIREPFIAFLQGSLTYEYGVLGIMKAIDRLINNK